MPAWSPCARWCRVRPAARVGLSDRLAPRRAGRAFAAWSGFTCPRRSSCSPSRCWRRGSRDRDGRGAARAEAGRGSRRRPGGVEHGAAICVPTGRVPPWQLLAAVFCWWSAVLLSRSAALALGAIGGALLCRNLLPRRVAGDAGRLAHGRGRAGAVYHPARSVAARRRRGAAQPAGAGRHLLQGGCVGVRRRPCRAAVAARRAGAARLVVARHFPCRLRRGAGDPGAALHLFRLSRRGRGAKGPAGRCCGRRWRWCSCFCRGC